MKRITLLLVWITPVILFMPHHVHSEAAPVQITCDVQEVTPTAAVDPMIDHVRQMFRIDSSLAEQITVSARAAGQVEKIDPWLIIAFIKVESDGQPRVVSSRGAVGLMQVLPSTGQEIAQKLGEEWRGDEHLFDVDTNIRYGTYYLRQLFNRFGTMQAAIAAYNWGPNHIARRIKKRAILPTEYPIKVLAALYTPPS